MSHEIRTPLNVISGMVREIKKGVLSPQQNVFINQTEIAVQHLLTIVNTILDMSKIDAGQLTLEEQVFSIQGVVSNIGSIMNSLALKKQLMLTTNVGPNVARAHIGDPVRLRQILTNLLGNSIKFTNKGYVSLNVYLLESSSTHQKLHFDVIDTGIGMSDKFLSTLFEKYTQEDSSARRREGTGLGMNITRRLIELMGGTITATSQKDKGTHIQFEIELPIGDEQKLVVIRNTIDKDKFKGLKVLLVEDNEMNRFIASQSLKHVGCLITEAENGEEGVNKFPSDDFSVVLMDIQMPIMDGMEATKLIRKKYGDKTPIIALTANAFKHDIDLYLSLGMNDYVIKPYKEEDLYDALSRVIDKGEEEDLDSFKIVEEEPIQHYDLQQITQLSRGDTKFVSNMVKIFYESLLKSTPQMEEALSKRDFAFLKAIAHKLKPSLMNMGVNSIVNEIKEIESYDVSGVSEERLIQLTNRVIGILNLVITEIKKNEEF